MSSLMNTTSDYSGGTSTNKVRYIQLSAEETKENWDKFVTLAELALKDKGLWWIVCHPHDDAPSDNNSEIHNFDVFLS